MQKTVYTCDHCEKTIGEVPHVSLVIQSNHPGSGIAVPPDTEMKDGATSAAWYTNRCLKGFMQFHVGCIEKYFKAQLAKTLKKPTGKKGK